MTNDNLRPTLPKGVAYRHSMGIIVTLFLMGEFLLYAAMESTRLNGFSWTYLWKFCFFALPIATIWHLVWLEKHGWWKRRNVQMPDLPFELRGIDWKATFETEQLIGQGGQLSGVPRAIGYANIKRIEPGATGGLNIVESGHVPITLGKGADNFLLVALLAHYAPQAEFRGVTAAMRDGWEPRF